MKPPPPPNMLDGVKLLTAEALEVSFLCRHPRVVKTPVGYSLQLSFSLLHAGISLQGYPQLII